MYEDEDKIIKDLLETNIRQRGDIGGSSIKLGRRIKELERIYGIKQGNNQHNEDSANGTKLTEKELAETKYNMFLLKLITKNLDKELIEQLENDSQYTDENFKFKNEMIKIFNKNKIKQVTNKK